MCLISACEYLIRKNNEAHPNIHPTTILLTESGQVKIADASLLKKPELLRRTSRAHRYAVPEEAVWPCMPLIDLEKCAVFQVGMTLLESALISDCSYVYKEDGSINAAILDVLLNQVRSIYGNDFAQHLHRLLEINPQDRPKFQELILPETDEKEDVLEEEEEENETENEEIIDNSFEKQIIKQIDSRHQRSTGSIHCFQKATTEQNSSAIKKKSFPSEKNEQNSQQ